jgi:hypothetical protein
MRKPIRDDFLEYLGLECEDKSRLLLRIGFDDLLDLRDGFRGSMLPFLVNCTCARSVELLLLHAVLGRSRAKSISLVSRSVVSEMVFVFYIQGIPVRIVSPFPSLQCV